MEKFVPYEKLSKKRKKEIDRKRRASWFGVNPVTRKGKSNYEYKQKKSRSRGDDNYCLRDFVI